MATASPHMCLSILTYSTSSFVVHSVDVFLHICLSCCCHVFSSLSPPPPPFLCDCPVTLPCVQVKERFDGLAKMWKSLPTDAQLLQRQALTEEQLVLLSYVSFSRVSFPSSSISSSISPSFLISHSSPLLHPVSLYTL